MYKRECYVPQVEVIDETMGRKSQQHNEKGANAGSREENHLVVPRLNTSSVQRPMRRFCSKMQPLIDMGYGLWANRISSDVKCTNQNMDFNSQELNLEQLKGSKKKKWLGGGGAHTAAKSGCRLY